MKKFLPYYRYLKPVLLPFIGGILLGLLYGVSSGFGLPMMIHYVFPKIFADGGGTALGTAELLLYVILLPSIFLLRGLSSFFNSILFAYSGAKVLEAIRLDVFRKIQMLQLDFFSRNTTGDLLTRITGDTGNLKSIIIDLSNDLIKKPITLISAMGALVYLSFKNQEVIFLLFIFASIPICVFTIRKIGRKLLIRSRKALRLSSELTNVLTENFLAAKDVRAFCLEEAQTSKLGLLIERLIRLEMKTVKYGNFLSPMIEIISAIGVSVTLFFAYKKGIGLEIFIPLVSALYFSYNPIKGLGAIHNRLKSGQASLERLEFILDYPLSVPDPKEPLSLPARSVRGNVKFENVHFAYLEEPTLKNVSFSVESGTTLALVGSSGAGKTTIANLLLRFYDVNAGRITIDGKDLRDFTKQDLRRNIAYVSQEPFLFNDTIYNNILYGDLDASSEAVYAAARNAYANEFIQSQPDGWQTVIGDRGGSLSGGQRQRIAIARAFLRNAPILILDEATSALDAESESIIQKALEKLVQNRTVFIIAHRFSTIRLANRILVLNRGEAVAQGVHEKLYQSCTIYKNLYDRQKFE